MRKKLALLLALVMLLSACGTAQPSNTDPSEETKNTVLDHQNGKTEMTTSGETSNTETTGDNSGTGTVPSTTEPTAEPTTKPTTEAPTELPTENTVPEDYTLKVSQSTLSLEVGQIGSLTAEYTGTGTLVWTSSNTNVATVSNGKVTAKAAGTAVITVTDGVKKSQCSVTITQKTETPVEITLSISKTKLDMKVGESLTLSANYNGTKSLSWTSSNTSVATVSGGKVTAKAAGTAYISVSDGVYTATCAVTVANAAAPVVVNLSVSPTTLNLVVGNTSTLTASYNGTGTLSWKTSNSAVATVANGKVTAKAAGTATITVSDGSKSATCTVTVTAPATQTLKINTKNKSTVFTGETLQIDYTYSGDKSELTWSSNNTSILTVDSNGLVTGKSAGSAIVKVTNGTTICRITIVVEASAAKTTSIEMNGFNAPLYDGVVKYAGDYMTFRAWTLPVESNRNITVTSSNSSVVSVSWEKDSHNKNNITLNFKSAGSATVTITSADGAVSKSYSITVKSDYACNPGSGLLTPDEFVYCYNQISKANGMSISSVPTGYLVMTCSDNELTWNTARRNCEGRFHAWWLIGHRTLVLTYEGVNEDGNHVFHVRGA